MSSTFKDDGQIGKRLHKAESAGFHRGIKAAVKVCEERAKDTPGMFPTPEAHKLEARLCAAHIRALSPPELVIPDNTGHALYVDSAAGNVGIHIEPSAVIPFVVGAASPEPVSGRVSDEQIMSIVCRETDTLDCTRVSELENGKWKATTIFDGDAALLRCIRAALRESRRVEWPEIPSEAMIIAGMEQSVLRRPSVDDDSYVCSIYNAMRAAHVARRSET